MSKVIKINEHQFKDHLGKIVCSTVEETLNDMLDAEADQLCNAKRYERTDARTGGRAGHYKRKLHTKAGEVELYLAGVLVRRVEDITEVLWGMRVSAGTVSDLNQKMYECIDKWRNRKIEALRDSEGFNIFREVLNLLFSEVFGVAV